MKGFKKFLLFLMFICLFSAIAVGLFGGYLNELAVNVRTGKGTSSFIAAQSSGDTLYALGWRDGYFIAVHAAGRTRELRLTGELPADYAVDRFFAASDGSILLALYEYDGAKVVRFGLYAAPPDGDGFKPLVKADCWGDTAAEAKATVKLSSFSESEGVVRFFVAKDGICEIYEYHPELEAGLVAAGSFGCTEELAAGIAAEGKAFAAVKAGGLIDESGASVGSGGRIFTRFMQREGGFAYLDGASGKLIAYAAATGEESELAYALPVPTDDIAWVSLEEGGSLLALTADSSLYRVTAEGETSDLTPLLYRKVWQSGLILAGFVLAILLLSTAFWYSLAEVKKLYFPIMMRNSLILLLVSYLLVGAALRFYIVPKVTASARDAHCAALSVYTAQLAGESGRDLALASERIAQADERFYDVEFTLVRTSARGAHTVLDATGAEKGFLVDSPGFFVGEAARVDGLEGESATRVIERGADVFYAAYARVTGNTVLLSSADARLFERAIEADIRLITLYAYGAMGSIVLIAAVAFAAIARGVRRVAKGMALVGMGQSEVKVVQNSGDEVAALASAFNDMTGALGKTLSSAKDQSESYLRFLPRQLVMLLGVNSVEEITRSTAASRDMTTMMVWLSFSKDVYQSDARELFENINEVIERTTGIVSKNGGTVYNFTSDGYDAVFSLGAAAAVSCAVEIRQEILSLNEERAFRKAAKVELRIAIDAGNMMMGVVGDETRMVPTAVSTCINTTRALISLAQRLDASILCTKVVADAAEGYALRYIGKFRGGKEPERVYEIYDGDPYSMRSAKGMMQKEFAKGVYALYARDFPAAKRIFMDIARRQNEDGATRYYLYLADRYEKESPEDIYLN